MGKDGRLLFPEKSTSLLQAFVNYFFCVRLDTTASGACASDLPSVGPVFLLDDVQPMQRSVRWGASRHEGHEEHVEKKWSYAAKANRHCAISSSYSRAVKDTKSAQPALSMI